MIFDIRFKWEASGNIGMGDYAGWNVSGSGDGYGNWKGDGFGGGENFGDGVEGSWGSLGCGYGDGDAEGNGHGGGYGDGDGDGCGDGASYTIEEFK